MVGRIGFDAHRHVLVAVNAAAPEIDDLANGARRSVHQIARGDHAAFESRVLRVVEGVVTQLETLRADEVLSVEQRSRVACKSITSVGHQIGNHGIVDVPKMQDCRTFSLPVLRLRHEAAEKAAEEPDVLRHVK